MATDKNSFVLYTDKIHLVRKLVEADRKNGTNNAGELFLHIFEYVCDEDPDPVNFTVDIAFEPIKQNLKKDLKKWESKQEQRAEAGRLGGLARAEKAKQKQANQANAKNGKQKQANQAVTVNGTVTVTATVNGKKIDDDVLYATADLLDAYLSNEKLVKAVLENNGFSSKENLKERLEKFNKHLASVGQFSKRWKDYTSHFLNWHKKNKNGKTVSQKSPTDVTL